MQQGLGLKAGGKSPTTKPRLPCGRTLHFLCVWDISRASGLPALLAAVLQHRHSRIAHGRMSVSKTFLALTLAEGAQWPCLLNHRKCKWLKKGFRKSRDIFTQCSAVSLWILFKPPAFSILVLSTPCISQ